MAGDSNQKRDEVLKRLLKTPPQPRNQPAKGSRSPKDDPMPTDDPEALIEWGKRNIQKD